MPKTQQTKHVAHIDCPGGGQVWVDGNVLYVGHMREPAGTTLFDISDPKHPSEVARLAMPPGWHSHKVRTANGIMLVNHERLGTEGPLSFGGGLAIYDVSAPSDPRLITKWTTGGRGVHRFSFDGRYAYISPTVDGYIGNIVMILDLNDPSQPEEVGRWWIPGQWEAGNESYPWSNWTPPRCHHPLRNGNRLYVSYWHHGFHILDIEDMAKPKLISSVNTSPSFPHPTHTCLVIPERLKGREVMVVADEDVAKLWDCAPAFAWIYDITNESNPVSISTFQVPGLDPNGSPQIPMTGCHQPSERIVGNIIPFAWFAKGLRLVDISNPYQPSEVGCFEPDPPAGFERASTNDVTTDHRGLVYMTDRQRGVDIVETSLI